MRLKPAFNQALRRLSSLSVVQSAIEIIESAIAPFFFSEIKVFLCRVGNPEFF
jgi:hypothetical protein